MRSTPSVAATRRRAGWLWKGLTNNSAIDAQSFYTNKMIAGKMPNGRIIIYEIFFAIKLFCLFMAK
jgi:hypothetical protein